MRYTNVFAFRRWLDSLGVVLAFWISILKSQITSKIYLQGYRDITSFEKTFVNFLTSYSEHFVKIWWKDVSWICLWNNLSTCNLVFMSRWVKGAANCVFSGSTKDKHNRCRKYDLMIIEMTIGIVFGPSTAYADLSWSIALWIKRRWILYDGPCPNLLREDRSWSSSPLIICWTHSDFGPYSLGRL